MAKSRKKISGQRFGMLTVLHDIAPSERLSRPKNRHVLCLCACGRKTSVRVDHLRAGHTKSCGCQQGGFAFDRVFAAVARGVEPPSISQQTFEALAQAQPIVRAELSGLPSMNAAFAIPIEWSAEDPVDRRTAVERKFDLPLGWYSATLAQQGGVCAICESHQPERALVVDHCHVSGRVRGLLCTKCNLGLGIFRDSAEIMGRAIRYVQDV